MKKQFLESDYENALMQMLNNAGWTCTSAEDLHRKYEDTLLRNDFDTFIQQEYGRLGLTSLEQERIFLNLKNTAGDSDYLSSRAVAMLCQNGFTFTRDDASLPDMFVSYIDYDHPERNVFRAVNQFTVRERQSERRPDILLFVNGIPLCIIELKNPGNRNATIHDAWEQITIRYRRDIPALMKFCMLACISDGGTSRIGTPYTPYEFFYAWKKVNNEDQSSSGLGEMETLVNGALETNRFLSLVRDYVFFPDKQTGQQKEIEIVCRYPQYFAVQKLAANINRHLRLYGGDGKGGTYFGATGCGKTYTMLFLARHLKQRTALAPTILIIVDREDLEVQSGKLFETATDYLGDNSIRSFESRNDLKNELMSRETGGVFITTVQKFCETTGLLSKRSNIICLSDEAHRSQLNLAPSLKVSDGSQGEAPGVHTKYGFAKYLHSALPNATFVGFTGTPIDDTVQVFGQVVDSYTMKQSVEDGITVPLKYEPRLARVLLDSKKAKEIEDYYKACEEEGAKPESIASSKRAMAKLEVILGDEDRLARMAQDISQHYSNFADTHSGVVTKAMIVFSTREIAYKFVSKLKEQRPDWFVAKRVADESQYVSPEDKAKLEQYKSLPMVNMVATRNKNDPKEMYDLLGDKSYRQMLDLEFKKDDSNFRIAVVVDMWITGFDVPSLALLYNDKPLKRHTLIQTISRVNRVYPGKDCGLIVDYIGIRENMRKAMKEFGGGAENPAPPIEDTYGIFKNELSILKEMLHTFDSSAFFEGSPIERLNCLQQAAEFVLAQPKQGELAFQTIYKGHVSRLKAAFAILQPGGHLNDEEIAWSNFFMAVQGIISKTTSSVHTVETMNRAVEAMVSEALNCTGVETVLNAEGEEELFSESFLKDLEDVALPHTKFQLLVKSLKKAIRECSKTNRLLAKRFEEELQKIVDDYNTRDKLTFTNKVATATVNAITEVIELFNRLREAREEFRKLGISFEEKAFYDILIDQREAHSFVYPDEKCLALASKIKELIDDKSVYADWLNNNNIKAQLQADLTMLLYLEGYPPQWDEEVFDKVMDQVNNFKKYNS